MKKHSTKLESLLSHFNSVLGVEFAPPSDLSRAAEAAVAACGSSSVLSENQRKRSLMALVNAKLKLNKNRLATLLNAMAKNRIFPNYHDKAEILDYLDQTDSHGFESWLRKAGVPLTTAIHFDPVTEEESIASFHGLLCSGNVKRKDARTCELSERQLEILRAMFGSYVFHAFPAEAMHRHFNANCSDGYYSDFYNHLLHFHPESLHRECALVYLRVTGEITERESGEKLRDDLYSFIREAYSRLSNHCMLAIHILPFSERAESGEWRLFSDLVLYAEKHREIPLKTGYFHPRKIEAATSGYIPHLDRAACRFELANEGFFFKDCFVLLPESGQGDRGGSGELLVLLEKNERDETVIPCPACRSFDVAGNSYPALGIRSWECRNPICPARSAFDRGNRYSLSAIIRQEAIKSEHDQIPPASIKRWKLDVVEGVDEAEVADMLIRHYTLHGDSVVFVNARNQGNEKCGRRVAYEAFKPLKSSDGAYRKFQNSALFNRFIVEAEAPQIHLPRPYFDKHGVRVYEGDCFDVMTALGESTIDGAVTSPPYYNAKSYSTWPNIYCYLYDMYNAACALFRALKPGSYYVFNIFDYFDNENSIVFSAMGKKRMILGAYIINIFWRVGFELQENIAWYKGEIEGKRNYNQGNRSPYYQAPLNCWEHCLVFRKPGDSPRLRFPTVLDAKPVYKFVRGENVLGHTAPFPSDIPDLILAQMQEGQTVLDPYSGTMTTGRTARRRKLKSISIERMREYCDLGISLLEKEMGGTVIRSNGSHKQQNLFD